jgi:hypothetical protein
MRAECAAQSVAKKILFAESPEAFRWEANSDFGPGFTLTQRSWFEPPQTTAVIRRFRFDQVILDPSWGVLFHDGHPIRESKYLIFDEQYEDIEIIPNNVVRQSEDRLFVLGRNNGYNNYYHWLIQCLPAIEAGVRGVDPDSVTIALPELSGWQERTLELLGFASVTRLTLEPARQYQFPQLEFSEYLNGSSSFEVSRLARDLFLRMSRAVAGPPDVPSDVVYVARTDSNQRVALNEPELIEQLRNRGVHIVIPGKLSIDEQIRTFRHARLVIAPHGAGLANVGFCTEGATLYEFFPGHYVNPCMHRLALACGLNYFADCFAANPDTDEWVHSKSWSIDIPRVLDRLDGIRSPKSKPIVGGPDRSPSLQDIMMDFESLGDNCEFGLVQRQAGAEPVSLLRFASPAIPIEQRPEFIADALARGFEGLGRSETISMVLAGEQGRREYVLRESVYHLFYHTFKIEGEIDPEDFKRKEARRLEYLRQKLMSDFSQGNKIWVWKSNIDLSQRRVEGLLRVLRSLGPNTLLWVVRSNPQHPPGSVEQLAPDLVKGYVERFAPYDNAPNISFEPWYALCQKAHALWSLRPQENRRSPGESPAIRFDPTELKPDPQVPGWPPLSELQRAIILNAISLTLAIFGHHLNNTLSTT